MWFACCGREGCAAGRRHRVGMKAPTAADRVRLGLGREDGHRLRAAAVQA